MKYLLVFVALLLTGCGTTIVEKTVVKTVTPVPSPLYTALEQEGITTIGLLLTDLRHIYRTEQSALDAGANGEGLSAVLDHMTHYSSDYKHLRQQYGRTNGGEPYGGKVSRLENLFEDAGLHVRKYGVALLRIIKDGSDSSIVNAATQQVRADQALKDVQRELDSLTEESY